MSLVDTTQSALEAAMSGSELRQTLLTNNLANASTPGYKPQDVNFQATLQNALSSGQSPTVTFQPYTDHTTRPGRQRRHARAGAGLHVPERPALRDLTQIAAAARARSC